MFPDKPFVTYSTPSNSALKVFQGGWLRKNVLPIWLIPKYCFRILNNRSFWDFNNLHPYFNPDLSSLLPHVEESKLPGNVFRILSQFSCFHLNSNVHKEMKISDRDERSREVNFCFQFSALRFTTFLMAARRETITLSAIFIHWFHRIDSECMLASFSLAKS